MVFHPDFQPGNPTQFIINKHFNKIYAGKFNGLTANCLLFCIFVPHSK